jgi:hypothetical protein
MELIYHAYAGSIVQPASQQAGPVENWFSRLEMTCSQLLRMGRSCANSGSGATARHRSVSDDGGEMTAAARSALSRDGRGCDSGAGSRRRLPTRVQNRIDAERKRDAHGQRATPCRRSRTPRTTDRVDLLQGVRALVRARRLDARGGRTERSFPAVHSRSPTVDRRALR